MESLSRLILLVKPCMAALQPQHWEVSDSQGYFTRKPGLKIVFWFRWWAQNEVTHWGEGLGEIIDSWRTSYMPSMNFIHSLTSTLPPSNFSQMLSLPPKFTPLPLYKMIQSELIMLIHIGTIYWSTANLPWTTSLNKASWLSSSRHQLSIAPQPGVRAHARLPHPC